MKKNQYTSNLENILRAKIPDNIDLSMTPRAECSGCNKDFGEDKFPWILTELESTCDECKDKSRAWVCDTTFNAEPPIGLPVRQRHAKPSELVEQIRSIRFNDGQGVYLHGLPGRGKSFQAACLLKRAWTVLTIKYGVVPATLWYRSDILLEKLRNDVNTKNNDGDWFNRLLVSDILVLDDFGSERITDWGKEKLLLVLSERYDNKRCTFITSNFSPSKLAEHVTSHNVDDPTGHRIVSRIMEMCKIVEVTGEDKRISIQKEYKGE